MSQTETHYGKLRKVETLLEIEEWCKNKCIENELGPLPSYCDDWQEFFQGELEFYKKYFIIDGEIWETIEHIEGEDNDIDIMIPNEDGTVTFVQQFYNGGTCLSEVIENGLKRVKK